MTYDFTSIMERHGMDAIAVDALGSGGMAPDAPAEGFDAIPMWVADMNFPTAPSITRAMAERIQHPAFGYFSPRDEYYQAIIDWDRVKRENVTALIEVKVVPQSIDGFDRIAERIYQYDEVESMYLMSGSFDLTVIISGRTLREVAQFVGERLAPLEGVTGTATHFILKKYKEKHLVFRRPEPQEREFVFS